MDWSLLLALLAGVGIAAACGLRAFLPLLVLGLAGRFGVIELREGASWLSSDHALWALAAATVLEVAADKIPVLDHALDVIGTALRPAAAWLAGYAALHAWPAPWAQLAALFLAALALGVHGIKAQLRLGSSASTLGHANPLLSLAEDGMALGVTVLAYTAPIVTVVALVVLARVVLRARRRVQRTPPTPPA